MLEHVSMPFLFVKRPLSWEWLSWFPGRNTSISNRRRYTHKWDTCWRSECQTRQLTNTYFRTVGNCAQLGQHWQLSSLYDVPTHDECTDYQRWFALRRADDRLYSFTTKDNLKIVDPKTLSMNAGSTQPIHNDGLVHDGHLTSGQLVSSSKRFRIFQTFANSAIRTTTGGQCTGPLGKEQTNSV